MRRPTITRAHWYAGCAGHADAARNAWARAVGRSFARRAALARAYAARPTVAESTCALPVIVGAVPCKRGTTIETIIPTSAARISQVMARKVRGEGIVREPRVVVSHQAASGNQQHRFTLVPLPRRITGRAAPRPAPSTIPRSAAVGTTPAPRRDPRPRRRITRRTWIAVRHPPLRNRD